MRRERHAYHDFRKVADAGAFGSVGPSVIENELAHTVSLQVERARGDDLFFWTLSHDQMIRRPSGVACGRAGILHRAQPVPFDERGVVGAEQTVPRIAWDFVDALD